MECEKLNNREIEVKECQLRSFIAISFSWMFRSGLCFLINNASSSFLPQLLRKFPADCFKVF